MGELTSLPVGEGGEGSLVGVDGLSHFDHAGVGLTCRAHLVLGGVGLASPSERRW
jgi:hypothetical protein